MTDASIITITFIITLAVLFLAVIGKSLRFRIERKGIWLAWERATKDGRRSKHRIQERTHDH